MSIEAEEITTVPESATVGETGTQPADIPAQTTEPTQPVVEEKSYTYQPTDENGRPLGGKQVLKYRTQEELIEKMQQQNVLLIRRLRVETRNNRLGISAPEQIPADAKRFEPPVSFDKRELTPDEKYKLAKVTGIDAEKLDEATDALFEAALGVKPDVLRHTLTTLRDDNATYKAIRESEAFMQATPEYVKCPENGQAITNWLLRYNLAPVRDNYAKAYVTLKEAGVLIEAPDTTPEPETRVEPVIEPPVVEPPATEPTTAPRIPTGLTRSGSTDTGPVRPIGDDIVFEVNSNGVKRTFRGLAAVDAMPSDVYKHRILHEAGFAKKVQKLEDDRAARSRK